MPKTLSQMKKRLEEAMSQANDAEEIIPLLKKVIAQYDLIPADLFDLSHQAPKLATPKHPKTPIARPQVRSAAAISSRRVSSRWRWGCGELESYQYPEGR